MENKLIRTSNKSGEFSDPCGVTVFLVTIISVVACFFVTDGHTYGHHA